MIKSIRLMALLVLCVMTSVSAVAQDNSPSEKMLRHEVTLGLGIGSLAGVEDYSFYDYSGHDFPMGNLHMQYLYNVNRHIGIGALLDFAPGYREVYRINYSFDKHGRVTGVHAGGEKEYTEWFTLSPTARFYWFNKKYFAMYSRLGLGVVFGVGKDNGVAVMPNVSPVSMEFGSSKLRFCTELLNIGSYGLFNAGVKYSF